MSTNQKIRFFAREAGHPEWLVDPWATDVADRALATVRQADENQVQLEADIATTQQRFVATTKDNLATIYERLTGERVEADLIPYTDLELRLSSPGTPTTSSAASCRTSWASSPPRRRAAMAAP